MHTE